MRITRLICPPLIAALAALSGCGLFGPREAPPVAVKVLAINDFHGNLKPPLGGVRIRDPQDAGKTVSVPAGGAEHLASALREARAKNPNHIFVAAGDLVGASPLLSALFHDEPTIEALGLMGLEASAVGNHEFDRGAAELLRQQNGGCHPKDGCRGPQDFRGARFQYLAASTIDTRTGRTLLPAYHVKRFEGIPVAFVGLTLAGTPRIVTPAGVAGLAFRDEAQTVNALVPQLRAQGIEAIVVLIHEGGFPSGDHNECPGISGPIVGIVERLDPAVDLVVSGHTHRAYNCRIGGRLVTSADKYGTVLTEIDLQLDPRSGDVLQARADNLIVRTDRYARDAEQSRLIARYETLAAPLAGRVVGYMSGRLTREENAAGESVIGQVVADAQLMATEHPLSGGAQIALMNPGGLRADLAAGDGGVVRYEDIFAVQPFYNNLVTLSLTGAQLRQLLEQQWLDQPRPRILQVSRGFSYSWDASRPPGQRVRADSLRLNGQPIGADTRYRVSVNSFLASGGDGFSVFRQGLEPVTGMMDVDAFEAYFRSHERLDVRHDERIRRLP
ncbi:5'-Nucleotidase domain protein [Leptothrix cholodnii SP-6]|uniref:5'-Nucleotidase domain protein n=1 Tax=Leptothrix cholodnii (strain ATCC 51168 / LMG 8142 / SP-6) TaxID=395495 RepID=B1XZA3_LEPCP|nr:bifunctional metallophosphatase/5'-nucleotidase [Leptothrix cholodnii]ACB35273.1 5'-Nucleotidase domain protein [Leptothrix cholodnii SP-6]